VCPALQKAKIWRDRENSNQQRLMLNEQQPARVPKFTEVGFLKSRVPEGIWGEIQAYYRQNRHKEVREGWRVGDAYVNHWESPTTVVPLTYGMRKRVFDALRPVLEEWSGAALEPTACYGIRLYHNRSVLREHVDRVATHAVSAIINVDQDVEEPWPLTILDHAGNTHTLVMQPGDMVYYESASAIHGRAAPLRGNYYANMFVHYRPRQDWHYD
jgi:hypothetical protein